MGWKDWPYWLKGGIVLTILYVLFSGIIYFYANNCGTDFCEFIIILIYLPFYIPFVFIMRVLVLFPFPFERYTTLFTFVNKYFNPFSESSQLSLFIINLVLIFILGSLFGLIYGKI